MPRPLTDDEAWIVSHNLPLVDHYLRGRKYDEATWEDLRAAGYLGLCYAIQRFDPEIAQWSTYATWWIRQCIQRELYNQSLVHIPTHHRANSKNENIQRYKANHGAAAERVLRARRIHWGEAEAIAVLAVSQPAEPSNELHDLIEAHIQELTEHQQIVIRRVVMQGERPTDVARDLGIKPTNVTAIRRRAIRMLMLRMEAMKGRTS